MSGLIDTSIVTHEIEVGEEELRHRLTREVCEFDGVLSEQDFLDETKAADDFLAKLENRHDR